MTTDTTDTTDSTAIFVRVLGFIMFTAGIVFWLLWMSMPCSILHVLADDRFSKDTISLCEALLSYSCIVLGIGLLLLSRMGEPGKELT